MDNTIKSFSTHGFSVSKSKEVILTSEIMLINNKAFINNRTENIKKGISSSQNIFLDAIKFKDFII